MAKPQPPPRLHTITPGLVLRQCGRAIEFYQRALGAEQVMRMDAPDGKAVWHAELRIGDSIFFVGDEAPGMGRKAPTPEQPSPAVMWVSVPDCDGAYRRALDAGATSTMAPADMFWGDRVAGVADPFGYHWSFAQKVKEMTQDEMRRAGEAWAAQHMPKK